MALSIEVNVLRQMPLFEGIDDGALKLIAFAGQRIRCEAGDMLCRQDEESESVYIVLDGEAAVFLEGAKGRVPLARLGEGQIIGEMGVLCNRPRTATVLAATALTVLRIEKHDFLELVAEVPRLAMSIIQVLGRRLAARSRDFADAQGGPGP